MESCCRFDNLPPEVAQQIIRHVNGKDLLTCRLVSTYFKAQTDKVIGFKNSDEDDPNLVWNPRHITQLKCNPKENFLLQVSPGTTVVKTQKQIKMFLRFASNRSPSSSSSPFKNGALIYRAASRMRISLLCANRDLFVLFDRPVGGLATLLSLYGHYLTSFVFDCKNQSFYQFLTAQDLGKILAHLPNLKFLGINVPFKFSLDAPTHQTSREQEIAHAKKFLPKLPCLEGISLGLATSAYCCRGHGDGILAWELILSVYGNQIKSLTIGSGGTIQDTMDSYIRIFCEEDADRQIEFTCLENLKIFDCVSPFDLLQCIALSPVKQWSIKRLSLQLRRCRCSSKKDFTCPLPSWSKSIPNIIMQLMSRFSHSLEELYIVTDERSVDVMHWICPCKYEWHESKEEQYRKFRNGTLVSCKLLRKISLPANRFGTEVMFAILRRCVALEELCLLKGNKKYSRVDEPLKYNAFVNELWKSWPTMQRIQVVKDNDNQLLHKVTRKPEKAT